MPHVLLEDAANALGVHPSTLRRWCAQGAPYQRARGAGRRCLYDPEEIRQYRAAAVSTALERFAEQIPALIDQAIAEAAASAAGPRTAATANALAFAGTLAILALQRAMGAHTIEQLPPNIARLREL